MSRYNVQCQCGYVGTAPEGSELEQRCIEYEKRGFIDALGLDPAECPNCQEWEQKELRRAIELDEDLDFELAVFLSR